MDVSQPSQQRRFGGLGRFSWVHVGVAVALAVAGATGVSLVRSVGAAGTPAASAFVPIVPCRLADTRPGADHVGTDVASAIAANAAVDFTVWGTNGNCTIPSSATAITANVTVTGPTADSFLTVYPADSATRPLTANMNWTAGSPPVQNLLSVGVSADLGKIRAYNLAGTVHVVIDIVGYYEPPTLTPGPPGPPGPPGATGPPGPTGERAPHPARVIVVATSGGDFADISDALASITDATAVNRYVVRIGPGTFHEPGGIDMKGYVDLVGSGRGVTTITAPGGSGSASDSVVIRATTSPLVAEVRDLSIRTSNVDAPAAVGVFMDSVTAGEFVLRGVEITSTATGFRAGILAINGTLEVIDSEVSGRGVAGAGFGIQTQGTALTIRSSVLDGDANSIQADFGATLNVLSSQLRAPVSAISATFHCVAVVNSAFTALNASCA